MNPSTTTPRVTQAQPYQKIRSNPQPFLVATILLAIVLNTVAFFHQLVPTPFPFLLVTTFFVFLFQWFYYLHIEANYEGVQTKAVASNVRLGFILFILSEILFFSCFFGSFIYYVTNLTPENGMVWPPSRVILIDPFALPLLNTVILLTSSVTVTWAHATLINGRHYDTGIALLLTIICGCIFLLGQIHEYNNAFFTMSTSVYGSLFYLLTGFHGFHVFCGTLFLVSALILLLQRAFSTTRHIVFECAAWYWHFVDVVWLFVYSLLYLWSSVPIINL